MRSEIDFFKHSDETLAYAAGLFDAEGNIHVRAWFPNERNHLKNPSYELQVQLRITDQAVTTWLQTTFGGRVTDCTLTPSQVKHGFRPIWHWAMSGGDAQCFLRLIHPFLKMKRYQATLAIEFHAHNAEHSLWFSENRIPEVFARNEAYRQQINSLAMARKQWTPDGTFSDDDGDIEGVMSPELSPTVIAYTAGLFDGEGSIRIAVGRPSSKHDNSLCHRLQIRLTNTNRLIIPFLQATFHGSIYNDSERRSKHSRRPAWDWTLYSVAAQQFLTLLLPYLKVKRQQAILGIEFQSYLCEHYRVNPANRTQEVLRRKEEYRQQIHQLNQFRTPIKNIDEWLVS